MNEDKGMYTVEKFSDKSILRQKAANDQIHAKYKANVKEYMNNYCSYFVKVNKAFTNNDTRSLSDAELNLLAEMALAYFSIVQNDVLEEVGPDYYVQQ